jgi:predicted HicB family RNase H-like nuclease
MKTFPLKLDDELHKKIRHAAIEDDISVHSWILNAIIVRLESKDAEIRNEKDASNIEKP